MPMNKEVPLPITAISLLGWKKNIAILIGKGAREAYKIATNEWTAIAYKAYKEIQPKDLCQFSDITGIDNIIVK